MQAISAAKKGLRAARLFRLARLASGLRRGLFLIGPELDIAILAQTPPLNQLALLPHQILNGDLPVAKDVEVIADDVTVVALRAGDEDRAGVVPLLGDVVVGAVAAGHAGEGDLVIGLGVLGHVGARAFG